MTNCTSDPIRFEGIKGRKVEDVFSGQTITSDGGGMLLQAADEVLHRLPVVLMTQGVRQLCAFGFASSVVKSLRFNT